jgi:hypothetical protein
MSYLPYYAASSPSSSSTPATHRHPELADVVYSLLLEQCCTSSDNAFLVSNFSKPSVTVNLRLKLDPKTNMLDVLLSRPDKFRVINAGRRSDAVVYAVCPPPPQSPLVDVLAASTPIERAHEIIDRCFSRLFQSSLSD